MIRGAYIKARNAPTTAREQQLCNHHAERCASGNRLVPIAIAINGRLSEAAPADVRYLAVEVVYRELHSIGT